MERRRLPRAALRGAGKPQIEPLRAGEPLRDVVTVPQVPDRLEVLVLLGLVLQVVGVLPPVEDEERNAALGYLVLVVVDLRRAEALDDRIPDQRRPAGSHQRAARLDQLLLEIGEASEVSRDELGELSGRLSTSARREVLPEDAVPHVPRTLKASFSSRPAIDAKSDFWRATRSFSMISFAGSTYLR